jgi:Resolvase, N terminal domain
MNPITGILDCCARAASGHAVAAPPSSVMNARRLTSSMGSPFGTLSEANWVSAYCTLRLPRKYRQVLGADLNRSESRRVVADPFLCCHNKLTVHILAAVAQHEREMIAQRTRDALQAAKARGKRLAALRDFNPAYVGSGSITTTAVQAT